MINENVFEIRNKKVKKGILRKIKEHYKILDESRGLSNMMRIPHFKIDKKQEELVVPLLDDEQIKMLNKAIEEHIKVSDKNG